MFKLLVKLVGGASSGGWLSIINLALKVVDGVLSEVKTQRDISTGEQRQVAKSMVLVSKRHDLSNAIDDELASWSADQVDEFIGDDFKD